MCSPMFCVTVSSRWRPWWQQGLAKASAGWRWAGSGPRVLERDGDAVRVELRTDRPHGACLTGGVVAAETVGAALVTDEPVGVQDFGSLLADRGGGEAAVRLPGQDDPVRLGRLDACRVAADLGEGRVEAGQ